MKRIFEPFEDVLDLCTTPYQVLPLARGADTVATRFIRERHYLHGCIRNQAAVYGLFDGTPIEGLDALGKPTYFNLLGVIMFACPCAESVRASVYGVEHKAHVTELHRLYVVDDTPLNTESFFIARALRQLRQDRPDLWAVVSFSDPAAGHGGFIYRATNADYINITKGGKPQYTDPDGRVRHGRQCGRNIPISEALERGWTVGVSGSKFKYVFPNPVSKRHRKELDGLYKLEKQPYPPLVLTANGNMAFRAGK